MSASKTAGPDGVILEHGLPMAVPTPSGGTVEALLRSGVVLTPAEAVALVYEICRRVDLWRGGSISFAHVSNWVSVNESGELSVADDAGEGDSEQPIDPATGVALLLERLLPAPSAPPDHGVAPSLRGLPARLRAAGEGGMTPKPQDLLRILRVHFTGDSQALLRDLVGRVGADSGRGSIAHAEGDTTLGDAVPAVPWPSSLDADVDLSSLFSAESADCAGAQEPVAGRLPRAVAGDRPPPVTLAPVRTRRGRAAQMAIVFAALIAASGYVGYRYGRFPAGPQPRPSPRTSIDVGRGDRQKKSPGGSLLVGESMAQPSAGSDHRPPSITSPDRPPPQLSQASTAVRQVPASTIDAPHPLMLPVGDGAFSPSFGPSGRTLLFHSGQTRTGRLLEAELDERGLPSAPSPILTTTGAAREARNYHPRLSPDARLIAFDSDRDGERGVYIADADGAEPRRVSGSGFAAVPSWSPDMKWLAFVRAESRHPQVWNVWLRDLTSGVLSQQTTFRVGQAWGASWFPDSHRLCYSHEDRLVVIDLAAGTRDVFRTPRPGRLVRTPAVSPDGRRIVFQVFGDGVWILDLRTRSMRRILDDVTAEEFAWDPPGRRIAYHSRRDGTWRIWMTMAPPA